MTSLYPPSYSPIPRPSPTTYFFSHCSIPSNLSTIATVSFSTLSLNSSCVFTTNAYNSISKIAFPLWNLVGNFPYIFVRMAGIAIDLCPFDGKTRRMRLPLVYRFSFAVNPVFMVMGLMEDDWNDMVIHVAGKWKRKQWLNEIQLILHQTLVIWPAEC